MGDVIRLFDACPDLAESYAGRSMTKIATASDQVFTLLMSGRDSLVKAADTLDRARQDFQEIHVFCEACRDACESSDLDEMIRLRDILSGRLAEMFDGKR